LIDTDITGLFEYSEFCFNTVIGNHHTEIVNTEERSMIAATKNRLICINIPEIKVFFIILNGAHLLSEDLDTADNKFLKIENNTSHHNIKLAIFFIIFRKDHNGASKCNQEP
jgi:hypothetical protein